VKGFGWMVSHRLLPLATGVLLWASGAQAQGPPEFDVGAILNLELKNTGPGPSSNVVNGGDAGFFAQWQLFLNARISEHISAFSVVQSANGLDLKLYGASAILTIRSTPALQVEVGKFLVPFGNFLPRRFSSENPLIGFPLSYEYRTSLSANVVPKSREDLLRARGHGEAAYQPSGKSLAKGLETESSHIPRGPSGLRVISGEVYITGGQIFGSFSAFQYAMGLSNGALSNPVDINNSNGLHLFGRLAVEPTTGLIVGSSFSTAPYLNQRSNITWPEGKSAEDYRQRALGLDVEFSRGHLVAFSEAVLNEWESPYISDPLRSFSFSVEGKYNLLPRLFLAARYDEIHFSRIADSSDVDGDRRSSEEWDYNVRRIEFGMGYHISRQAVAKVVGQVNQTLGDMEGDPRDNLSAFQIAVFF